MVKKQNKANFQITGMFSLARSVQICLQDLVFLRVVALINAKVERSSLRCAWVLSGGSQSTLGLRCEWDCLFVSISWIRSFDNTRS